MKTAAQNPVPTFDVNQKYVDSINAALGIYLHEEKFKLSKGAIEFSRPRGVNTPNKERVTSASELISKSNDCINEIIAGKTPTLESKRVSSIITEESNRFGYNMLVAALVYKNKQAALNIIDSLQQTIGLNHNQILSLAIFAFDDTEVLAKLIKKGFKIITVTTKDDLHPAQVAAKLKKVDALALLRRKFPKDIASFEANNPGALTIKSPDTVVEMPSPVNEEKPGERTNTNAAPTVTQTPPKKKKTLTVAQHSTHKSPPKKDSKEGVTLQAAKDLITSINWWSSKKEVSYATLLGTKPMHRKDTIEWEDVICKEVTVKKVGQNCILAALCHIHYIHYTEMKETAKKNNLNAANSILTTLLAEVKTVSKLTNQEALFEKALELLKWDGGACYNTLSSKGLKPTEAQQERYEQRVADIEEAKRLEEERKEDALFHSANSGSSEEEAVVGNAVPTQVYTGTPYKSPGSAVEQGVENDNYTLQPKNLTAELNAAAEPKDDTVNEEAEKQRLATAAAEEAERQRLAAAAAKQARTSKCKAFGGVFSVISAGGMYAIYANQELVLSVLSPLATPVLENAYFTAAHTAIANTEFGNVIISFVIENSQECMIAAASLAIIASLITSFALGYKLADVSLAQPTVQPVA